MTIDPRAVYFPVRPNDPRVLGPESERSLESNGLFYRPGLTDEIEPLRLATLESPETLTLPAWQYVVEDAWKREHGTSGAVDRFTAKLREEIMELKDAICEPNDEAGEVVQHVVSELGDVNWCGIALTSNAGVNLDGHVKDELFGYVRGVVHWVDGTPTQPGWRALAGQLATKWEPLTINDIDDLFAQGFETLPSKDMNIFSPPNEEGDIYDAWVPIAISSTQLIAKADEQYAYGGRLDGPDRDYLVTQGGFEAIGRDIGGVAARLLLNVAHMAHWHLDTTLAEVIRGNATKLQARVQAGLIDKQDGVRTDSLK